MLADVGIGRRPKSPQTRKLRQTAVISLFADSHQTPLRASSIFAVPLLCCNKLASTRYPRKNGTMASAGKYIHQYETRTLYCCKLASMFPQVGTGSGTPNPKNDRVISASTNCGTKIAACVSTALAVSGKMCFRNK